MLSMVSRMVSSTFFGKSFPETTFINKDLSLGILTLNVLPFLGSLSTLRNVTKKNVWNSGFKSSNVSQETPFSKAVKKKPVVKSL